MIPAIRHRPNYPDRVDRLFLLGAFGERHSQYHLAHANTSGRDVSESQKNDSFS